MFKRVKTPFLLPEGISSLIILFGELLETKIIHFAFHYDLFDAEQSHIGSATVRFFSLGQLLWPLATMDLYDSSGNCVGYVYGRFWTSSAGKFEIYDPSFHVATAYLDMSCSELL